MALTKGASDQFMNQHLLGKMHQLCVANLGSSLAIACNWRLDLTHFPCAAERLRINQRLLKQLTP